VNIKPLGRKNYGHIPHLPSSRMGLGDHKCHEGQARIATEKKRDKHDEIIVQEKLDGSNVGVARIDGQLYPLGRAGWPAISSPHLQHRLFHNWVFENYERFMAVLEDGERLVGEWVARAHGTRYDFAHAPFFAFDLMIESWRMPYDNFVVRISRGAFMLPCLIHRGQPPSIRVVMKCLNEKRANGTYGFHGALEPVEGAVWRVERDKLTDRHSGNRERVVDFLVKYVRPDKIDGKYLDREIWNWKPAKQAVLL